MLTKDEIRIIETALRDGGLLYSFRWHDEPDKSIVKDMWMKGYLVDAGPDTPNTYAVGQYAMELYRYAQNVMHPEWRTRPLNEMVLEGLRVLLPPGTYHMKVSVPVEGSVTIVPLTYEEMARLIRENGESEAR